MQEMQMMATQRRQRGQSLVELALALPILLLLLGGVIDLGRGFLILVAVENAAGEGALYGAVHPECLADDHAATICQGTESVDGRVYEEGRPIIELTAENSEITVDVEGDAPIIAGSTLLVTVTYHYAPLTPLGRLLWGETAQVIATARQQLLSPPPPGYQY
jgi:hypothetical protein